MSLFPKLFIPGPTHVSQDVLDALSTPQIGHRTPEISELINSITPRIQNLLYTRKFTIKGAKQYLKQYYGNSDSDAKIVNISNQGINNDLLEIKAKLERIIDIIDNSKK